MEDGGAKAGGEAVKAKARVFGWLIVLSWFGSGQAAPAEINIKSSHSRTVVTSQVYLFESVPVETQIGNSKIGSAAVVWPALIQHAEHSLCLEEFYFSHMPGEALQPVVDEIGRAAARGVHVRLIIDHSFHATYPQPADSLAKLPNIEIRYLDFKRVGGGVQHSKYFTVDGKSVYLGSQNLDWRSLSQIHELGVWIADSAATQFYQDLFELDWRLAGGADVASTVIESRRSYPARYELPCGFNGGYDTVQVEPSYSPKAFVPDSTHWDGDAVIRALDAAQHEVVIQTLTYSPKSYTEFNDFLDRALRRAAARGVRVKLLVSDWNLGQPGIGYLKDLSKVPGIEIRISEVPYFSGGYISYARVEHCKYFVADSMITWIGTSNWEPDYFFHTRNVGVTLTSRRIALEARKSFESSWTQIAKRVDVTKEYPKRPHGETPPPGMKKYGG